MHLHLYLNSINSIPFNSIFAYYRIPELLVGLVIFLEITVAGRLIDILLVAKLC